MTKAKPNNKLIKPRPDLLGYKNLFLAGDTVYPRARIPLVILSGKSAVRRV